MSALVPIVAQMSIAQLAATIAGFSASWPVMQIIRLEKDGGGE